jgi:chemotaxis signal transduction protein
LVEGRGRAEDEGGRVAAARYCVFALGDRSYALPASVVIEVASTERLLAMPLTREWIMGVHNLRGRPLTVVDLGRVLDDAATPAAGDTLTLLVVRLGGAQFAFAIDRVEGFAGEESVATQEAARELEHPAVAGLIARPGGRTITVLNDGELASRVCRVSHVGRAASGTRA